MHTLYRCYGVNDLLLYVGLTCNPGQRFTQHRDTKEWWRDIDRIKLEQYPDRATLVEAERTAITTEQPLYTKDEQSSTACAWVTARNSIREGRMTLYENATKLAVRRLDDLIRETPDVQEETA
jgi:predicted GIY-YIG superfamily endonuclease